jgi:hypothetical protein
MAHKVRLLACYKWPSQVSYAARRQENRASEMVSFAVWQTSVALPLFPPLGHELCDFARLTGNA